MLRTNIYTFFWGTPPQINVMQDLEGRKLHLFAPSPPLLLEDLAPVGGGGGGLPGQGGAGWPLKYPRCITIQDIIQTCRFYVFI